jgi:hypothetical protein
MENNVEFFLYGEKIPQIIQNASHMSPYLVEAYDTFTKFCVVRNHMYIKSRKSLREVWVQTK